MSDVIRCANCRRLFHPSPRVKNQRYCGLPACQRARKAAWQRERMKTDPDYQDNQRRCRKIWTRTHPQYWKTYRSNHPQYVCRNRTRQNGRDQLRRLHRLAKMDASTGDSFLKPGRYFLIPQGGDLAKMDALRQKILLIPMTSDHLAKKDGIAFSNPRR